MTLDLLIVILAHWRWCSTYISPAFGSLSVDWHTLHCAALVRLMDIFKPATFFDMQRPKMAFWSPAVSSEVVYMSEVQHMLKYELDKGSNNRSSITLISNTWFLYIYIYMIYIYLSIYICASKIFLGVQGDRKIKCDGWAVAQVSEKSCCEVAVTDVSMLGFVQLLLSFSWSCMFTPRSFWGSSGEDFIQPEQQGQGSAQWLKESRWGNSSRIVPIKTRLSRQLYLLQGSLLALPPLVDQASPPNCCVNPFLV